MGDNSEEAIDEPDCRDSGEKDKPEVEEDVDLFINDVQWENTESVVFLNGPRRTILVENTFCNLRNNTFSTAINPREKFYLREDSAHGVSPLIEISF